MSKSLNNVSVLEPLIAELGIKKDLSKAVLAGLVMGTIRHNDCGLTNENAKDVKVALMQGLCDDYLFSVVDLASSWDNDLLDILVCHESQLDPDTFYSDHIWPFLRNNEIVPGVQMKS